MGIFLAVNSDKLCQFRVIHRFCHGRSQSPPYALQFAKLRESSQKFVRRRVAHVDVVSVRREAGR